ncbi:MAG: AMP-binding protein [Clostridia bacterium]|nr:AMP-binding protein [Clostridia bacterium]
MIERFIKDDYTSYEDFYNRFEVNVPGDFNFGYDVIDAWAEEQPDKLALVWCDDHGHEERLTFGDIARLSSQAAHYFQSLGLKKGDAVLLMLRRRYEYWFIMPALHKLGVIAIPATNLLMAKDIVYRVNVAKVRALIVYDDEEMRSRVEQAMPELFEPPTLITLGDAVGDWQSLWAGLDGRPTAFARITGDAATHSLDPMLIYFTSGTTGMPKMVLHNYTYPLGHIVTARYWHALHENSLHITVADTGWAKCSWGKMYGQWIVGAALFVYDMDKFVPLKLLEKLSQYRVTSFCAPPTIYRFMVQENIAQFDLSSLERCTTAGEPLNPEVYNKVYQVTGLRIAEGFGQSESTPIMATFKWLPVRPGSMGKPSPGYDVELINDQGEVCDVGEEGELIVFTRKQRPIGLFAGYYNDPATTKAAWHYGAYHTGDIAWKDEDGYYWFVGRADDVIKSSGYRIGPFEVESALMEHPAVVECAISAVPHPVRGQIVKATIVLAKGYEPSDELVKTLQDHVKRVTAPYKYPRVIDFVQELPKTHSGKIRRAELREQDKQKYEQE